VKLQLRDLFGNEHVVGVAAGRFGDPGAVGGPVHDLRSLFAMGGLADCHAHLSGDDVDDIVTCDVADIEEKLARNATAQLESGVLLLAEKGSKSVLSLKALDIVPERRPRIQMAGRMVTVPGGYYPGFAAEIDGNLEETIAAAASGGTAWVKLVGDWPRRGLGAVPNFTEEELRSVVDIAHGAGCRVAIHAAAPDTPSMAVRAGVDSIEHGLFLTAEDLEILGARGGAWVPTVVAMEHVVGLLGESSRGGRVLLAGLENTASLLPIAIDCGVAVLAGTDLAIPHGEVAREAVRLTEYGLSNRQAISSVSTAAYEYLGEPTGFVAGRPADAVLFDIDPTMDPGVLLHPRIVMRAGRIVTGSLDA
jgi:imidazolonepropionase-like amidohydrolase